MVECQNCKKPIIMPFMYPIAVGENDVNLPFCNESCALKFIESENFIQYIESQMD